MPYSTTKSSREKSTGAFILSHWILRKVFDLRSKRKLKDNATGFCVCRAERQTFRATGFRAAASQHAEKGVLVFQGFVSYLIFLICYFAFR